MVWSNDLFQELSRHLPLIWWTTDLEFFLTSSGTSSGLTEDMALTLTDAQGRRRLNVADFNHPGVAAHLRARTGETVRWQTDGPRPMQACMVPITDARGEPVGVAGVAVDQAGLLYETYRRELAESQLYTVMENFPAMVSLQDQNGRVLYANRAFIDASGLDREQILGRPTEIRAHRIPLPSSGNTKNYASVSVDATDLESARAQAEQCRAEVRFLLDHIPLPAALLDPTGRITGATKEFTALFHLTDESGGSAMAGLLADESRGAFLQAWHDLAGDDPQQVRVATRDHGRHLTLTLVSPASDEPGRSVLTVVQREPAGPGAADVRPAALDEAPRLGAVTSQALEKLAAGENNTEISAGLYISRQGLDYHLGVLRRKLGVTSRCAIVARAYSLNMFQSSVWPPKLRADCLVDGPKSGSGRSSASDDQGPSGRSGRGPGRQR